MRRWDATPCKSQQRTARAQAEGLFDDEIVPMHVKYQVEDKASGEKSIVDGIVAHDDCNRADTTLESLAALKPVFADDGSVTAGNASQLSDGASMTLVMSLEKALELGLKPLAFFRGFVAAGCEPDEMGIGPVFSVPKLLRPGAALPILTCGNSMGRSPAVPVRARSSGDRQRQITSVKRSSSHPSVTRLA